MSVHHYTLPQAIVAKKCGQLIGAGIPAFPEKIWYSSTDNADDIYISNAGNSRGDSGRNAGATDQTFHSPLFDGKPVRPPHRSTAREARDLLRGRRPSEGDGRRRGKSEALRHHPLGRSGQCLGRKAPLRYEDLRPRDTDLGRVSRL